MILRSFFPLFLTLACLFYTRVDAQQFQQRRSTLNLDEWTFHQGAVYGADSGDAIDEQNWQKVKVPHTWNAHDVLTDGVEYRQGSAWYRTSFNVARDVAHSRIFLRFEGVSTVADVYCNGEYLGTHKGGYSAFIYEITRVVRPGETNWLAVKVNNEANRNVAPSNTSLYPLFGGIYRPVTIFSTPDVCVSPLDCASSGVYIHPLSINADNAELAIDVLVDQSSCPEPGYDPDCMHAPDGSRGLLGSYFKNGKFEGTPSLRRVDSVLDFDYKLGAPAEGFPVDGFSIRWEGNFTAPKAGIYRFQLSSDDGSRLTMGGKVVINNWGMHAASPIKGDIELRKGETVPVLVEYYEGGENASVSLKWAVFPAPEDLRPATVDAVVKDAQGNVVTHVATDAKLTEGKILDVKLPLEIKNPKLWDGRCGANLYSLEVSVTDGETGMVDTVVQPLGIRRYRVDKKEGLLLNGHYYDLHGVARHQEIAGYGPALSEAQHKADFALIEEIGATGIRLAHYQQADIMYEMADKAGMVVWAEIPNTPVYREGNPAYLANCRQQLEELIKQNYNHPSILFWGLYNEINIPEADLEQLNDLAHRLDPGRLTTAADLADPAPRHTIPDVQAWNKYFGWYYGDFGEYDAWFKRIHDSYPDICAGLSEYGAGGSVTQHAVPATRPDAWKGRFYPEEYESAYHEQVWERLKDRHDIWCKFVWNLADFSWTLVNRGDRPYINHKGLVTHDRKIKKDAFYFYKANWSSEPTLHVCSQRFTVRHEKNVPVTVYTNLDSAELYLNGKLVSRLSVTSDIHKVEWPSVELKEGLNNISVIGRKGDIALTDSCEWNFLPKSE